MTGRPEFGKQCVSLTLETPYQVSSGCELVAKENMKKIEYRIM